VASSLKTAEIFSLVHNFPSNGNSFFVFVLRISLQTYNTANDQASRAVGTVASWPLCFALAGFTAWTAMFGVRLNYFFVVFVLISYPLRRNRDEAVIVSLF
jgi:hypothetical protein